MASADWTFISDALSSGNVARGVVTSGVVTPPNGGGSFTYGFNSRIVVTGVVALFTNLSNFAPTPASKGGTISGAVQRGVSGGDINFAPFLFAQLGGTTSADKAYILGLSDSSPAHIELRKGSLALGLVDAAPAPSTNGILSRSTSTFNPATWLHLRLDAIVEPNGDVFLKVWQNDLTANAVSAPAWTTIPGMADFTDDALGINTGSLPYTSGRMGFGFYCADTARRAYFDHLVTARQL